MTTMATTAAAERAVPFERRLALLAAVPAFAALPAGAREELSTILREEAHPAGAAVFAEGDVVDRLFLIARGSAEASPAGSGGAVPARRLRPGDLFGELALLAPGTGQAVTVTALTPLLLLTLDVRAFERLLAAYPQARAASVAELELLSTCTSLWQAGPFMALDDASLRRLAGQLERVAVPAGATVIRQGEPGDVCYVLHRGRVEVLVTEDGLAERRVGTLGPGTLFGEAALLTTAPRSATVRALERCELFALRRADLLAAMRADPRVAAEVLRLVRVRDRPRRAPGILAHRRATAAGETIAILKDPRRGRYYRLSPQGWFLWERLDGRHTLRDLTLDYLAAFQAFAPEAITAVIDGLMAAGFVEGAALRADVRAQFDRPSAWDWATRRARRLLDWQVSLEGVDAILTRLYRGGIHLLYTRPAQCILALVALGGLVAFAQRVGSAGVAWPGGVGGSWLWLFLIPAALVGLLVHEAGHAFTVKAFGHEVPRAGIGLYWLRPMAFVDTSDIWLAGRWPRVAVSLAGPYTNLVLGGFGVLAAGLVPNVAFAAALWQIALTSYVIAFYNLNPLLEFDGYYALSDLLDRPNLRRHALVWLRRELPAVLRGRSSWWEHRVELLYGLAVLLYAVALLVALTVGL